ncbi:MAG: carboxypeptidase-like regulatory domain-containing protein, partial [Pseudothermotoga sp.]
MKRWFLLVSTLFIALLVTTCTTPQPPTPQEPVTLEPGTLTGVVKGGLQNTIIYGAEIIAQGGGKTYKTYTDKEGKYTLHLPAGTYNVTASMETFNGAATSVTISATETQTRDFILTTGTGETPPQITADSISVQLFTGPAVFDVRSIDTRTFTQSLTSLSKNPADKQSTPDYWSSVVFGASLSSATWGSKGTRLYISQEQEGPYFLCGSAGIGPEQILRFYPLVPDETYYFRLSVFGTWGEVELTNEPVQIKTPKPLVLLTPENDEQIGQETIEFTWEHIWESFEGEYFYLFLLFDENLQSVHSDQTQDATYTYWSLNLPYGKDYYWLVYTHANEEIEEDGKSISKEHISISYPRRFTILYQPGDNLVRNGDFSSGELAPWIEFEESGFSGSPPDEYEWTVSATE